MSTFLRMHPELKSYFNHVWPLFWPWLVWNLLRVARWHTHTGQEALVALDCFGNIRFICVADAPPPDTLYTYEAPRVPRWERPAVCSDVPVCVRAKSALVRHDPAKSGIVRLGRGVVRYDPVQPVRGPP